MNKYESVCILAQNCTSDDVSNMMVKIQNKIEEFSNEPISFENIGKRKLAYEIKKNTEGYYLVVKYKANATDISELERFYRINDKIIKFITIKEDE